MMEFEEILKKKNIKKKLPIDIYFTSVIVNERNRIKEYEQEVLANDPIRMNEFKYSGYTLKLSKKCISKIIIPEKIIDL